MKQTKKIRLVIEVDVQQDTELTPDVIKRVLGTNSNYAEWIASEDFHENLLANEALLAALLANRSIYTQFFFDVLGGLVEGMSFQEFLALAGQAPQDKDPLISLVSHLSEKPAAYLNEAIKIGALHDSTELTRYALDIKPVRIYVEDVA
jgi:hypothetical protein